MGFMSFLPLVGSVVSGLFGGGGRSSKPAQSTAQSGWQNLPPQVQQAYLQQYLPAAQNYFSQAPNQYEQQLQQMQGGGIKQLEEDLPDYQKFFAQANAQPTLEEIQRQADMQKNVLQGQAARSGLGGLLNSNVAGQLSELQNNADRLKAQYSAQFNRENTQNALNLRAQTLQELMNAGNQDYNKLSQFAGLLGSFPGGSTQTSVGGTVAGPNVWDKVGGGLTALSGAYNQWRGTPWLS
jgi:hypothetical protein